MLEGKIPDELPEDFDKDSKPKDGEPEKPVFDDGKVEEEELLFISKASLQRIQ